MTLLVSQVEALRTNFGLPFIHEWETSLQYGNRIEDVLNQHEVLYDTDYAAVNGEAVQTFVITFTSVEQIEAYLRFEQLYVKAELLKNIHSVPPRKRFWMKNPAPVDTTTMLTQLHRSYDLALSYLTSTVTEPDVIEETFN